MRRAIELARNAPRHPFGALLVDLERDAVLAEGWNKSGQNPIWHGEIDAINRCAARNPGVDWTRLTLYTTAEPCPMCQGAVAWTGIGAVVYGSSVPFLRSLNRDQIEIRAEEVARRAFRKCVIIGGVLERECDALFRAAAGVR
jgi:tRNA(adenine34) deaminase